MMKRFVAFCAILALPISAHAQIAISGLPVATSASGSEIVPIVQSGSTKQISAQAIANTATLLNNNAALYAFLPYQCRNILAYGGDNTGTNDNVTAFNSAVSAAANTASLCVYLPTGSYKFASTPTVSLPSGSTVASVTIRGDGADSTKLLPGTNIGGLALNLQAAQHSFHIRDLSILATNVSTSSNGIAISQTGATSPNPAISDITGVTVRGADGYNASYKFGTAISMSSASNVNIINTSMFGSSAGAAYATAGNCLFMQGSSSSIPVQINIIGSQINYCQYGLYYGNYLQGVQISTTNFVGNSYGIYLPSGQSGNDQLAMSSSQMNSGTYNILLQSNIDGVTLSANDFYLGSGGTAAIQLSGYQYAISGNTFIGYSSTAGSGIVVGTYALDMGSITGNGFSQFAYGIVLGTSANGIRTAGNNFANVTGAYYNQGTTASELDIRDRTTVSVSGTTGLGTGGSVSLTNGSSSVAGTIQLTTGSSGAASSGSTTLTFGFHSPNNWICTANASDGTAAWTRPVSITTTFAAVDSTTIGWANGSTALTAGTSYVINYHCQAM